MSQRKQPTTSTKTEIPSPKDNSIAYIRFSLILLVLMIYGQSVNFEFTLDDDLFYLKHQSVQQGISAISDIFHYGSLNKFDGTVGLQPYRPITLFVFALQKTLFDNSPAMAHLVNVLLYIIMVQMVFSLARRLLPNIHIALIGMLAVLFAVHPIHTEVVASIKSLDELLAAIFCFGAWMMLMPNSESEKPQYLKNIFGYVLFFLGLLSKESAIAFLLIIPLCNWMFFKSDMVSTLKKSFPLLLTTMLFLFLRYLAIGNEPNNIGLSDLDNVLHAAKGIGEITATKAVILFYYIKLLFVPYPLNWDYSYQQIPVTDWMNILPWIGLIIYAALFAYAILNIRKNSVLSFAILFFFITTSPTNNLFFLNGATIGERFLFVPSFGFVLGIVILLVQLLKIQSATFSGATKNAMIAIFGLLTILFTGLSFARTGDWKNNITLFEKGVERSPNSSRTHYSLATTYLNTGESLIDINEKNTYLRNAILHFSKSLEIYPQNKLSYYNAGLCYTMLGDTNKAISSYQKAIEIDHKYLMAINNLGVLFQGIRNFDSAQLCYERASIIDPKAKMPKKNLSDLFIMKGIYLSQKGESEAAIKSYQISMQFNSDNNAMIVNNIASIYANQKNYDSALHYLKMGYANYPKDLMILQNIAAVSYLNKAYMQAIAFAMKALEINGQLKKSFGVLADTYAALGNTKEASRYRLLYNQAK